MDNKFSEIYEESEPVYKTTLYKKILPLSCAFWFICIAASIVVGYTVENATVRDITIGVLIALCAASVPVLFFVIMPKLQIKQARLDIKNYDFTPYVANGEEETFYGEIPIEIYHFKSLNSLEEEESKLTVNEETEAYEYLKNFPQESCSDVIYLDSYNEFIPFYTYGFEKQFYAVSKKSDGELISVIIAKQHELTFTAEGVRYAGKLFPYSLITVTAEAMFSFKTYARIMLELYNGTGASFAISPRIIAVLDKFGVKINDRFIADFIIADPECAFEKIAALSTPKRVKRFIQKNYGKKF